MQSAHHCVKLIAIIGLSLGTTLYARPASAAPPDVIPGQYIVVFDDGVPDPVAMAHGLAAQHGLALQHVYGEAIKGFAAVVPAARLALLQAAPGVAYVAPDRVVSIEAQTLPTGIDRIDGDLSSAVSGNGSGAVDVDVAVIDTGIDTAHKDLSVAGGRNCSTGKPNNFKDGHGHGTHVAGTIGAKDDSVGVVGVAPGARLWAVRVLNNAGSGTTSSVICGIDWVAANAGTIEVANMSLGGGGSDDGNCGNSNNDPEHRAICNAVARGVTIVVAAGNSAIDAATFVPAAYDEVITVSALADFNGQPGGGAAATCRSDVDDTFANFSNFGADIDLIAPGACIYSTWKGGGYATSSGTSMSSPHAAGAAALYKAGNPGASPAQVKTALQSAGNTNWNSVDDPDGTQEKLVNVDTF